MKNAAKTAWLKEKPLQKGSPLSFSVVIIAKNAQNTIRYTLESLKKQSRKPDEIIVVVSSPEDNTLEALKDYPEVQVVIDSKATRGSARATGVRQATGDIIAFTDAECVAHLEWLRVLETTYIERKDVLVQGGPIISCRDLRQTSQVEFSPSSYPINYIKFIPTANFSFRREVVSLIGNFDETLHEGEDLDFCARLSKHNIRIVLNLGAKVYHLEKTTFSLIKRYMNYGKSRARVFFMHPSFVFHASAVAAFYTILIPIAVWALIIERYDVLLIAIGLPLLHQFYNFRKVFDWRKKKLTTKTFVLNFALSYSLYASFVVSFFYYLIKLNKKRFIKLLKNEL
jgi:glycosyltransferase involved in cell wall biosynthesis